MKFLKLIKWPAAAFTIALLSFVFISVSNAKTAVAPVDGDNCAFTVTVQLAFAFLDEGSQNKADDLIKTWSEAMSNMWNGPDGHQTTGDCACQVKFVFDIVKLDKGKDCRQAPAEYHCFNVVDQPTNQRGNVADSQVIPPDGKYNGYGEWTTHASGNDAAHEIGHLMGLLDEYKYDDTDGDGQKDDYVNLNPQKNPDGSMKPVQSIMAQTWGDVAPTQEQIDKIIKDGGQACPAECCCGNGKVDNNKTVKEECDPKANPNGCAADQECTQQCACIGGLVAPKCGDGQITGDEECDDAKSPPGCQENQFCANCLCFDFEAPPALPDSVTPTGGQTIPPAPADTPVPPAEEMPVDGGETAPAPEPEPEPEPSAPESEPVPEPESDPTPSADEPASACGDGICSPDESCETCPGDCGACAPVCGDGVCYPEEECICLEDCPICWEPECTDGLDNDGDGLIDMEDPGCSHPLDESEYDDWCGNGVCEPEFGEDPTTCEVDCL